MAPTDPQGARPDTDAALARADERGVMDMAATPDRMAAKPPTKPEADPPSADQ